jgi:hypothetical protein
LLTKPQPFGNGVGIFDISFLLFAQTGFEFSDGCALTK